LFQQLAITSIVFFAGLTRIKPDKFTLWVKMTKEEKYHVSHFFQSFMLHGRRFYTGAP